VTFKARHWRVRDLWRSRCLWSSRRGSRRDYRGLLNRWFRRCASLLGVVHSLRTHRRLFDLCLPSSRRRFHLPLQLEQVATEKIGDFHAQLSQLEKLLAKLMLPPEEENSCEWRRDGKQSEHYEYELHLTALPRMYETRKPK